MPWADYSITSRYGSGEPGTAGDMVGSGGRMVEEERIGDGGTCGAIGAGIVALISGMAGAGAGGMYAGTTGSR